MATFTIKDLSFVYPHKDVAALKNVNLQVNTGEFITLCGKSGSGKSTLMRCLKPILAPFGRKAGQIYFYGKLLDEVDQREQSKRIGYVLQNPDNQLVTDKVWHELAFGLESLGYDTKTIRLRVAEMASFFGIQEWFAKDVNQLSGGQKQLLNLAAVMVMQPDVLLLDEPTSQLDPIAAGDFLDTVRKINQELGTTVIISEHRLEEVLPMSDRAIVIHKGEIIANDTPSNVGGQLSVMNHEMFKAMPTPLKAYAMLYKDNIGRELHCPINVRDGRKWLTQLCHNRKLTKTALPLDKEPNHEGEKPILHMKDVWFKYNRDDKDVLKDLSMDVYKGELFALVGGNGTGKTTTLTLASGINRAYRGKVSLKGKSIEKYKNKELFAGLLGVLPQNPQAIFVEKTVRLDLEEMLEGRKLTKAEKASKIKKIIHLVELEDLMDMHPYDLSGGEQQRAALGKILLLEPEILMLDEPTKGLDSHFKEKLAGILKILQNHGVTILMVSHDIEFCGRYADRCAMFFDGKIVTTNEPRAFFSGNSFYTTAANRMSRHIFENAVTAEDIVDLCKENISGSENQPPHEKPKAQPPRPTIKPPEQPPKPIEKKSIPTQPQVARITPEEVKHSKSGWLVNSIMLVLAPLTVFAGAYFLDDRKYYFISVLLIIYTIIPFFAGFERRKPQSRELIIISVMIAIAVVGRAAFFMIPQFKPVLAIVIISGMALGKQSGFFVGAMSAFVSNFMFGQGPWTPWQMFAMGIIGFVAGWLAEKHHLGEKKLPMLIFGGFSALVVYGLIVDVWTIFMTTPDPTLGTAITVYSMALPFNIIHGVATVVFLFFLAKPMLEKLDRIKNKYGMTIFTRQYNY
ncbi:MAG: energy-coupling factor transporter ATPase [Anaerovoracaceae bacterium]